MKTHLNRVAHAFNQAAASYDDYSNIQLTCGEQLTHKLLAIRNQFNNVIDAGCGTGYLTRKIAAQINYQHFTAIDISENMLPTTYPKTDIEFLHGDFNNIHHHRDQYDLIFSNLALHWSNDLISTFHSLHLALNARGLLAFSMPLHGTLIELSNHFSVQDFKTLEDIQHLLSHHHFRLISSQQQILTNAFPSTLSALLSIKKTGTNFVSERRHHGLRGKEFLMQCDIRRLTYNVGFFIAEKQDA